jgi:hypothetical protein
VVALRIQDSVASVIYTQMSQFTSPCIMHHMKFNASHVTKLDGHSGLPRQALVSMNACLRPSATSISNDHRHDDQAWAGRQRSTQQALTTPRTQFCYLLLIIAGGWSSAGWCTIALQGRLCATRQACATAQRAPQRKRLAGLPKKRR